MRVAVLFLVPLLLVGCGGGGSGSSSTQVELKAGGANPASVTVPSSSQVVFVNHDTADHQVASGDCAELSSGKLSQGMSATVTLGTGPKSCTWKDSLNPTATAFQGTIGVAAPVVPGH